MSPHMSNVSEYSGESRRGVSSVVRERFREVLGHFATGVCVVTAIDVDHRPTGLAIGSFTSVSFSPPLVAFLPGRSSVSFPRIRSAKTFCVNVLGSHQQEICRTFAASGDDKFGSITWKPAPSGSPVIDGVIAWIDCALNAVHEAGDHYIAIGRVTALDAPGPATPLVFFRSEFGSFTNKLGS